MIPFPLSNMFFIQARQGQLTNLTLFRNDPVSFSLDLHQHLKSIHRASQAHQRDPLSPVGTRFAFEQARQLAHPAGERFPAAEPSQPRPGPFVPPWGVAPTPPDAPRTSQLLLVLPRFGKREYVGLVQDAYRASPEATAEPEPETPVLPGEADSDPAWEGCSR